MIQRIYIDTSNAPLRVRELLQAYDKDCFENVLLTKEARELADCYIAEKVVGKTSLEDCWHIAIATLNKVDVLASWNFKHIVNLEKIKGYNSVNLKMGYAICNSQIKVMIESFPVTVDISTVNKSFLLSTVVEIKKGGISNMPQFDDLHTLIIKMKSDG
jgi:hypothetical protein